MGTKMAMRNKMIIEFIILKSELMKDWNTIEPILISTILTWKIRKLYKTIIAIFKIKDLNIWS
jgi:hypothetical protein